MEKAAEFKKLWLIEASIGILTIGAGACMVAASAIYKFDGAPLLNWMGAGTVSLIVLNAGVCVFGDSISQRMRYERALEKIEQVKSTQ